MQILFFLSEDRFSLANSADPDEMPPYVAFHLGLHCLPKYLFVSSQDEKSQLSQQDKQYVV